MNRKDPPCYRCTDKYLGCHDSCPDYQEWSEQQHKWKEAREKKEYEIHQYMNRKTSKL